MVTEEDVRFAYAFLLGREPESVEAIRAHLDCASLSDLARRFLASAEFQRRENPSETPVLATRLPLSLPRITVELDLSPSEMERLASRVERTWRGLGTSMPHWSVLSADRFRPDQIAQNKREFYDSGGYDAELLRSAVLRHGGRLEDLSTCLEYGCGVGRVTGNLARMFPRLIACDISETHLQLAREWCVESSVANVEFRRIESATRPLDGLRFDAFFSRIVLQHSPPPLIAAILRSALSGLRPGGYALFQVPTYGLNYSFVLDHYQSRPEDGHIEMHCLPQAVVFRIAAETHCEVLEIREDMDTGQPEAWVSNTFVMRRQLDADGS